MITFPNPKGKIVGSKENGEGKISDETLLLTNNSSFSGSNLGGQLSTFWFLCRWVLIYLHP